VLTDITQVLRDSTQAVTALNADRSHSRANR
jgi:hypothetical protein